MMQNTMISHSVPFSIHPMTSDMKALTLSFEELDALLALIEFHDDWEEVSEIVGADVALLYDKLSEMRDEV